MSTTPPPLNPYEAPQAAVVNAPYDPLALPLASPWLRLGAAFIDGIVLWPIGWILGKLFFHTPSAEAVHKYGYEGAISALSPGMGMLIIIHLVSLAIFLAVNFVFLQKGQTIGKMALKLQIQNRHTSGLLTLQDLVVKRILPVYIVNVLLNAISPFLGVLLIIDALCIFRPGRNTLHDDLAQTKVVKLPG